MTEMHNGRTAWIVGADSVLGQALARHWASLGMRLLLQASDGDADCLETLSSSLRGQGVIVETTAMAIRDQDDAELSIARILGLYGRLDILCCISNPSAGLCFVADTGAEHMRQAMDRHFIPTFCAMSRALRVMRRQGQGRIVNVISSVGIFGGPQLAALAATHGAILGLTRSAASEYNDVDVRINALAALTNADVNTSHFVQHPDLPPEQYPVGHIVPAVDYLGSLSCQLSGETLSAGGGRFARIFAATAPGYYAPEATAESLHEHLDSVLSTVGYIIPTTAADEFVLVDI